MLSAEIKVNPLKRERERDPDRAGDRWIVGQSQAMLFATC